MSGQQHGPQREPGAVEGLDASDGPEESGSRADDSATDASEAGCAVDGSEAGAVTDTSEADSVTDGSGADAVTDASEIDSVTDGSETDGSEADGSEADAAADGSERDSVAHAPDPVAHASDSVAHASEAGVTALLGAVRGSAGSEGPRNADSEVPRDVNGPGLDEQALRALLHTAVDDIEPAPHALDHLRHAVPARRARKRQALVGAAAAVLLVGSAVPALVHVARDAGVTEAHPANAGHSERTQGGSGGTAAETEDGEKEKEPSDKETEGGKRDRDSEKGDATEQPGGGAVGGGEGPSETMAATSPTCTRDQLSGGVATPATLDGSSTVYGSFQVTNVSDAACTVDGGGQVFATAQGGADGTRISVVDHTAGDPATALPDPATQPQTVILQPGVAYQVKFAWVPAEGGAGGCPNPGSTPDPGSSGAAGEPDGATVAETAEGDQGTPPAGSVALSHTPQAGAPSAADATITNACAGTIYRTGALATA
ncbi:hypothetical protein ABT112_10980 [Streptomyces sp. NPDC002055]|uniref:hypothetical protein n=1 Tax=Streptomyces sp. NPDC002055 TaxID=3154534 RepID=UPI00332AB6A6